MFKYYFSETNEAIYTDALYDAYVKSGSWPIDAVEISAEVAQKFHPSNQPVGQVLGSDINGEPVWVDAPPPSQEEITSKFESEKSALKVLADSEINWRQDAVDAGIATNEESTDLTSWKKYRIMLMRSDLNSGFPEKP